MGKNNINQGCNSIDSQTVAYALIGKPVHQSLSPLLYNAAFRHCGLNRCYLAFGVEPDLVRAVIEGVRSLGYGGLNVTSPHKETVLPYLDKVSDEATLVRSVNTIVNRDGLLHGHTTDGPGFCRFLREEAGMEVPAQKVLLVGAGGASRAIAFALAREGAASVTIANRTLSRAQEAAELIGKHTQLKDVRAVPLKENELREELKTASVVINGLAFDEENLIKIFTGFAESGSVPGGSIFADLRYSPGETELMKLFRRAGGQAFNGKGMLLWQAVLAFELFTEDIKDIEVPVDVMRRTINI